MKGMRLRDRFARFMYGRYGLDEMGRFMLYASIVLILLSSLFRWPVLYYICLILLVIGYFRMFSKNIYKRSYENDRFMNIRCKVLEAFKRAFGCKKNPDGTYSSCCNCYHGDNENKKYKIFKCPECKQKLRVPRGKGKIQITCRRCGKEFVRKT